MDNTSENQNIPEVGHTPLFISKSVFSNYEPIEQLISDFNPDEIANINSRNDNLHFSAKMEPECISDEVALKEAQLLSKTTVICNSIICSLIAKEDNTSLQTIEDEIEEMNDIFFEYRKGSTKELPKLMKLMMSISNVYAPKYKKAIDLRRQKNTLEKIVEPSLNLQKENVSTSTINTDKECAINETAQMKLKNRLREYHFFELSKVKQLSNSGQDKLIESINTNEVPYNIAMFNYLGFLDFILKQFSETINDRNNIFAEILHTTTRNIKGNINILNANSKENKERFKAYNYIEITQKDYNYLEQREYPSIAVP